MSFPGGSVVKNPPTNAGDLGSIPGSGRSLASKIIIQKRWRNKEFPRQAKPKRKQYYVNSINKKNIKRSSLNRKEESIEKSKLETNHSNKLVNRFFQKSQGLLVQDGRLEACVLISSSKNTKIATSY